MIEFASCLMLFPLAFPSAHLWLKSSFSYTLCSSVSLALLYIACSSLLIISSLPLTYNGLLSLSSCFWLILEGAAQHLLYIV